MTKPRKITANYVETEIDDEILLVDLDGGELFSLSGTAREIWRLIDGEQTLDEIADTVARGYSVEEKQLQRDVARFVAQLRDAALVADTNLSSANHS
ncbi:PqqD family protein [Qipengyuania sp. 902]|uniref:PqqD family protein n=1 Tax=Qipengyuania sp. 902 TaxID=3417565 RepID=UPI003EBD6B02